MGSKRFDKAMRSVRASVPTTGIEKVYGQFGAWGRPVKRFRGAVLYAGLAAIPVLIVLASLLLTQPAKAVTLQDMADALAKADIVHIEHLRVLTGDEADGEVLLEEWREGDKYRHRTGHRHTSMRSDNGYDGNQAWRVDFEDKSVEIGVRLRGQPVVGRETVDEIIERYRSVARENPKVSRSSVDGVETIVFQAHSKYDYSPFRIEVTVDQKTSLIMKEKKFNITSQGKWVLRRVFRFSYPEDIPDEYFKPQIPDGFTVYNYTKVLKSLIDGFNGHAQAETVEGIEITLLGAFQDQDGTVRVLWTGGAVPPLFAEAAVFDTDGNQHLVDFWFEDDSRARDRNYGVPPKDPPPIVPGDETVIKLRPMGFYKGEPYYCMHFNPGRVEPNMPMTYNVVIPVCEPVEPYIQQPGKYVKHEARGKQVGVTTFRVTTTPVKNWLFSISTQFDPEQIRVTGSYSAKNIGLSSEEKSRQRREHLKRMFEEANRRSNRILKFAGM